MNTAGLLHLCMKWVMCSDFVTCLMEEEKKIRVRTRQEALLWQSLLVGNSLRHSL